MVLLLLAHRRAPFSCHCLSLGLSLGPFSTQILFVVVLFSLVLSMVPLFRVHLFCSLVLRLLLPSSVVFVLFDISFGSSSSSGSVLLAVIFRV